MGRAGVRRPGEYAVAYDVSSDRERLRVEKLLLGYGFRVQKSVFECKLNKGARERLVAELTELNLETGYVYIYRVQHGTGRIAVGKPPPDVDGEFAYVV